MHTILVDLGARVMRFTAIDPDGRELQKVRIPTDPASNLPAMIKRYALEADVALDGAQIWISTLGPFEGDTCRPFNLPRHWGYTAQDVRDATGAARVEMLHDSLAYALAIPEIAKDADTARKFLLPVHNRNGQDDEPPRGTAALIRMGVGLGAGALIEADGEVFPISGEAGNATLAAHTPKEFELLQNFSDHLAACGEKERPGPAAAEAVLAASSLRAIYHYVSKGLAPPSGQDIFQQAIEGTCPHCVETVAMHVNLLGTFAATVALTYDPPGGLYIFGELARKFDASMTRMFRERFNDRGLLSEYMTGYDVFIVDYEWAPFIGLRSAMIRYAEW